MYQTDTNIGQVDRIKTSQKTVQKIMAVIFALFTFASAASAQETPIRVETELVAFEVSVTDADGKPVRGLSASDFLVLENGIERSIDFFQPIARGDEGRPLSVVFALDVSGSMTKAEIGLLTDAMRVFVDRLADYNSYFAVMSFAMDVKTLQSFTNRPERLLDSLKKLHRRQDGLSTHAYDAVDDAIRMLDKRSPKAIRSKTPKRAVIVITDGFPVGDTVSPGTVIERANNAETSVYAVILPSYSRTQRNRRPLLTPLEASGLVERTGGQSFYASEINFEKLFAALMDEITASYAIAFYPGDGQKDANVFNTVTIESRSGLTIRQNRPGYRLRDER